MERSRELVYRHRLPFSSPQRILSGDLTTLVEAPLSNMRSRLRGVVTFASRPPIHTLPEELLLAIFKFSAALYPHHEEFEDSIAGSTRFHTFSLVQLTHVCKRWRDTALAYPCLWFYIDLTIRDRAQVFLERSRAVPLWFRMQSSTDSAKEILTSGGERIMRLDLEVSSLDSDELALLLHFTPSSLECLTVTYDYNLDLTEPHADPTVLFHQEDLPLKALAIKGGHRWLPINYLPQLTHLHLDLASETGFPVFDLYALLARTPQLQYLFICFVAPHQEPLSTAWPSTSLPQIRFLSFACGHFESSARFIANLVIPETAMIQLDSMVISDVVCPQLSHLAPMSTLHTLEIAIDEGYIHLVAHGNEGGFWLQGVFETDPSFRSRWLGSLHAMFSVPRIKILKLYIGDRPSHFFPILRQMSAVYILEVHFDRQHEDPYTHSGLSHAHHLYTTLAISPVCPNLEILAVDIAGEGHEALPNLHIGALTRALAARGPNKLKVHVQPLADRCCVERSPLEDVLTRITVHARVPVHDIIIHRPRRPIAPLTDGIWWHPAEAFKYWDIGDYEPFYRLPWDR